MAVAQFPTATVETVPEAVVAGLGVAGTAFVMAAWCEFAGWTTGEIALLRMAGQLADDVAKASDARGRRQGIKAFAAIVHQLGMERK